MPDDAGGTRQVDPVGFIAGINARNLQQAPKGPPSRRRRLRRRPLRHRRRQRH
jgi:hypothetical protein